jgi:hypothetical protein
MRKDTTILRNLAGYDCYDFTAAVAYANPWCDEFISFVVTRHKNGERRGVCKHLEFDFEVPEGTCVEPTFRLHHEEAQELMDRLWTCGLRPSQAKAVAGTQAAIERHLEDMRVLAFSTLDIPKP